MSHPQATSPSSFQTLPALFQESLRERSRPDWLMHRGPTGEWEPTSSEMASTLVREISLGLSALGVARGDRVGILAPSGLWWLLFDVAALSLGAVTVPLFSNLARENLEFEVRDAGLSLILAGDPVQRDTARQIAPAARIVSLEEHGGDGYTTLAELRELGRGQDPAAFERAWSSVRPDDLATLIYTSGSTGRPKGVRLTHRNLVEQVRGCTERYRIDPIADQCFTCLPMAHVFERMVVYFHLSTGARLVFGSDIHRLAEELAEIRPSILTVVPRLLERILERIEGQAAQAAGPRGWIARAAMGEAARRPGLLAPAIRGVLDPLAWRRVRGALGGRLRLVVCGGAALSERVEVMFRNFGVPVFQGYGMTEHSPVVAANFPGFHRLGSVGLPFPGVEVRIAPDEEVLVRSRAVFDGYWNLPGETQEALDAEGWLHTGDLGRLDEDGFLFLTGRKKDLCKMATGKYVAPAPIEEALAAHRLVEHAVVDADGRKFVSALIVPDRAGIQRWIADKELALGEEAFLAGEFNEILRRHVAGVNNGLNEWERVKRWVVALDPFTVEGGELTPTLKVRRGPVLRRHAAQLDALYASR